MSRRSRDATPAIRGIKYQCDWSILTWIGLEESAELYCETDEDWKTQLGQTEVLYQSGLRSHNLTLFDEKILRTIYEFTRYSVQHLQRNCRYVFVSNASVGREQGEHTGLLAQASSHINLGTVASKALAKITEKCSSAMENVKDSYWRTADINFTEGDVEATLQKVTWLMQQPAPEDIEVNVFADLKGRLGVAPTDCPTVYAVLLSKLLKTTIGESSSRALRLSDAQAVITAYHQNREEWLKGLSTDAVMQRILGLPGFESIAQKLTVADVVLTVGPALTQVLDEHLVRHHEQQSVALIVNGHYVERMNEIYRQYETFTADKLKEKIDQVVSDDTKAARLFRSFLDKRQAMWKFKEQLQTTQSGASALAALVTETYYALEKQEGALPEVAFKEVQAVLKEIVTDIRKLQPNGLEVTLPSDVLEGIIHDLSGRCAFRWTILKTTA